MFCTKCGTENANIGKTINVNNYVVHEVSGYDGWKSMTDMKIGQSNKVIVL